MGQSKMHECCYAKTLQDAKLAEPVTFHRMTHLQDTCRCVFLYILIIAVVPIRRNVRTDFCFVDRIFQEIRFAAKPIREEIREEGNCAGFLNNKDGRKNH